MAAQLWNWLLKSYSAEHLTASVPNPPSRRRSSPTTFWISTVSLPSRTEQSAFWFLVHGLCRGP